MSLHAATTTRALPTSHRFPRWLLSFNTLLVFVPLAIVLGRLPVDPLLRFAVAAIALVPLAIVLARATEDLSAYFNPTVASLFNATAGNIVEILIAYFALRAGLIEVVKASIVGSVLVNILLLIGLSVFIGGFKFPVQKFNRQVAGVASSMLLVSIIGMAVPTVYGLTSDGPVDTMSRAISLALGGIYLLGLVFTLVTHRSVFRVAQPVERRRGLLPLHTLVAILVGITVAAALVSSVLVESIQPVTASLNLTGAFIGLVVIAVLTNVSEKVAAVTYALRNQMDLSMSIGMNSATQIALFAAPIIVLIGWAIGQPMSLVFTPFEMVAMVASVLVLNHIAADGECNWLEGAQLLTVYMIIIIAFFFVA